MDGSPSDEAGRGRGRQVIVAVAAALAVASFITLLVVGLTARGSESGLTDAIARGEARPAPEFSLPLLINGGAIGRSDGDPLALADLRGRSVVLNFWASWCVPCQREAPRLERAWLRHREAGVVVLGLDVQDLEDSALAFVRRYGQTYPSVRAREDGEYRAYGLTGVPETFFIDVEGVIQAHVIGEISDNQLEQGIALLAPPSRPTRPRPTSGG